MEATPVVCAAEPGSITVELKTLDLRLVKLRRFAEVKRLRRELLVEYQQLEDELFGAGYPVESTLRAAGAL